MSKGVPKSGINKGWFKKGQQTRLGMPASNPFKKGNTLGRFNKGRKRPELVLRNKQNIKIDVSYKGIHQWINRNFGKPKECEFCDEKSKMIHWSNKNHKYSRERKDWQQLCVKCHRAYDKGLKRGAENVLD